MPFYHFSGYLSVDGAWRTVYSWGDKYRSWLQTGQIQNYSPSENSIRSFIGI